MEAQYEICRRLERTHQCGICTGLLTTRWNGREDSWEVVCGTDHRHQGFQAHLTWTETYRRGQWVPPEIRDKIERRLEMSQQGQQIEPKGSPGRALAIYEASTGYKVVGEQALAALDYARAVGLLPELGHICLYFSKPWVTIDGWYYRFRQKYPGGHVVTFPLLANDRQALMLGEDVHAWKAEVYDSDKGALLSVGYGYARAGEKPLSKKSAVEPDWPWRMAEKRAEEDALRKAVPLEIEDAGKVA